MIQLEDSRYSIISCAQRALRQSEISEEAAKDAILSLALIGQENFDFLECFIECRVKGVKELLEENSTDSSMLMEELGQHLQYSVRLLDSLFFMGNASPLNSPENVAFTAILGASAEIWPKFLPLEIVQMATIDLSMSFTAPSTETLQKFAKSLINQSAAVISECLPAILERVHSGEKLANFRDLIQKSISLSTRDHHYGELNATLVRLFDGDEFLKNTLFETLKSVFNARLEGIIFAGISEIQSHVTKVLDKTIEEFQISGSENFNISSFVWSQKEVSELSQTDESNIDWARKNLSLRAKSFHPVIVEIVNLASERLNVLLKDVKRFTNNRLVLKNHVKGLVDFFVDFSTKYCGEEDSNPELALFIARCCYALTELCDPLQSCLADEWISAKEKLISKGDQGIQVWTNDLAKRVGEKYSAYFPEIPDERLLSLLPALAHQTVSEESEGGEKVESEIDVPQYISIPLSGALQFQAREITKFGAHSLRKNQLRLLVKVTFNAVLDVLSGLLEKWNETKIAQPVALQLLFDCRYVAAATGSLVDQKFQNIQQELEQLVDPFDLAVLSPNITVNATKAVQKTAVIHGAIVSQSNAANQKHGATSTSTESHNILKLAQVTSRFSSLPVPSLPSKPSVRKTASKIHMSKNRRKIEAENTSSGVFSKIGGLSSWFAKE